MSKEDGPLGFIRNTEAGGHYFRDIVDGEYFANVAWGSLEIERTPTLAEAEFIPTSEVSIPKEFI